MAGGGLRGCRYSFAKFTTPELREADFLAAPMVLLLGQYSTGKTSMIEYLIDSSIPGRHIGPEPTTDKFVAVMHGEGECADTIVPGHAAVSQSDLAFKSLETYGSSFLPKFEVARVDSEILRQLTIIDSPGVLSGEKQSRGSRGYDYASVTQHFAERADRIILLFDCSKLDISDEVCRLPSRLGVAVWGYISCITLASYHHRMHIGRLSHAYGCVCDWLIVS
eukprot:COSAG01_NODE_12507_length_1726_cov_11.141278_1_plen_222_part_00